MALGTRIPSLDIPAGMEMILEKDTCAPTFVYWSVKNELQNIGISPGPGAGKRKRLKTGASVSGGLVSWKEISHRADTPPDYLQKGLELRQPWVSDSKPTP